MAIADLPAVPESEAIEPSDLNALRENIPTYITLWVEDHSTRDQARRAQARLFVGDRRF